MEQQHHNAAEECSPRDWQRFYLGYRERFVDDCCIQLSNGKEVRLKQAPSAKQFKQQGSKQHKSSRHPTQHPQQQHKQQQQLDKQADPALTGSTVWDGAVVLAQYLSSSDSPLHLHKAERAKRHNSSSSHGIVPTGVDAAAAQPPDSITTTTSSNSCCEPYQAPNQQQQPQQQQQHLDQQDLEPHETVDNCRPAPGFTCLELGAGTGAVSLSLLAAGMVDWALITDIPDMLPHLASNVQHNSSVLDTQRALVLPLRWAQPADVAALEQLAKQQQRQQQQQQQQQQWCGLQAAVPGRLTPPPAPAAQLQPPFELILGSDLIYYSYTPSTPHSRLLLQALVQLAGPESLIFLALSLHHNPEEVHAWLQWAAEDWGFHVEHVTRGIPQEYVVPDVVVVKLQLQDPGKAAEAAAAAAAGALRRTDEQ